MSRSNDQGSTDLEYWHGRHLNTSPLQTVIGASMYQRDLKTTIVVAILAALSMPSPQRRSHFSRPVFLSFFIALAIIFLSSREGVSQTFNGDLYPSLSNIEVQNTTVWMQLLGDRLAAPADFPPSQCSSCGRCARDTVFEDGRLTISTSPSDDSTGTLKFLSQVEDRRNLWNSWVQGYGLSANISGNTSAGGLNYQSGGTIFGCDRILDENLKLGAFGGYTGTSASDRNNGSTASNGNYQVGVYGAYHRDGFYFSHIDAICLDASSVNRPPVLNGGLGTATASTYGNEYAHYSEAGVTMETFDVQLQPFVGTQYQRLDRGGFTESGAGPTNLVSGHDTLNSMRCIAGARISKDLFWNGIKVTPQASARYQHELFDGHPTFVSAFASIPATTFPIAGNYLGRDFGLFTIGATASLANHWSLYMNCGSQVSMKSAAVLGSTGLQFQW